MARKTLGKPRFYADILQYLKALGYYDGSDTPELWTLDPTNSTKPTVEPFNMSAFKIASNKTTDRLLTNIPQSDVSGLYAGVLGHNLGSFNGGFGGFARVGYRNGNAPYIYVDNTTEIINIATTGSCQYDGYSLWNIDGFGEVDNIAEILFNISTGEQPNLWETDLRLGAYTYGRWFEPEFAFDLKGTVSNGYDGITTQTTVGGHTLSNIKHLGQPNWGNGLPAWTLQKQDDEDYNVGGAKGRKQWQVGFSFLSDDKLFNKEGNPDKFFTYDEDTNQHTFDTSLASFYKLTLNGKLPFIFCPDNDADEKEFALCRITNQPSFSQVANNLWSTSLVITETW